jgi:hypothetical protein
MEEKKVIKRPNPYKSEKREETKALLNSVFIKNTSLPLWLADLACQFDTNDRTFYETKLKPLLERRGNGQHLSRYQNQVKAFRNFVLANYPAVVDPSFCEAHANRFELKDLTHSEELCWKAIEIRLSKPNELNKLHQGCKLMSSKAKEKNRIAATFSECRIFQESFENIKVPARPT